MTYDYLRKYIISGMNPDRAHGEEKNYQSVVIRFLNQTSNGIAEKSEIITELQKENPDNDSINSSTLNIISGVLQKNKIVSEEDNLISLLDFESYTTGEKAEITKQCEKRIYPEKELHEYFILRHNVDSPWDDVEGNKYHFGNTVPNQKKLRKAGPGTKTIWFTKYNREYYFWGYGTVKDIEVVKENEDWNLIYDDYTFFKKQSDSIELDGKFLKHGTELIQEQIEDVENFNNQHAMVKITKKIYEDIVGKTTVTSTEQKTDEDTDYSRTLNILRRKKNIILYGPPGTGKTFTAKEIAKEFQKENNLPDFFMLKGPWSNWGPNLSRDMPQWATTDVPSNLSQYNLMKVGDYVILQNNSDDLGPYDVVGYFGIGKITKLFDSTKPHFEDEIAAGKIIWKKRLEFEIIKKVERKQMISRMDGLPATKGLSRIADIDNIKKLVEKIESEWGIILRTQLVTFHQSYGYEDFVEGIRPKATCDGITYPIIPGIFQKICDEARRSEEPFVVIIDEINRGNISKIFGELITIIENDKRDSDVFLAYSGKSFSVPKNVYIIGTMNTADQSLTHMDAALKRRFSLVEIMPDSSLLKRTSSGIPLGTILEKINDRIIINGSRDNQIGHSYFMDGGKSIDSTRDLQFVFATDIIPLLRDYFYDDEESLKEILGGEFINWESLHRNVKEDWQGEPENFITTLKDAFGIVIDPN